MKPLWSPALGAQCPQALQTSIPSCWLCPAARCPSALAERQSRGCRKPYIGPSGTQTPTYPNAGTGRVGSSRTAHGTGRKQTHPRYARVGKKYSLNVISSLLIRHSLVPNKLNSFSFRQHGNLTGNLHRPDAQAEQGKEMKEKTAHTTHSKERGIVAKAPRTSPPRPAGLPGSTEPAGVPEREGGTERLPRGERKKSERARCERRHLAGPAKFGARRQSPAPAPGDSARPERGAAGPAPYGGAGAGPRPAAPRRARTERRGAGRGQEKDNCAVLTIVGETKAEFT